MPPIDPEDVRKNIERASDVERRLARVLNDSGEFWVETQEIDGGTYVRFAISDRVNGGPWIRLTAETSTDEEER